MKYSVVAKKEAKSHAVEEKIKEQMCIRDRASHSRQVNKIDIAKIKFVPVTK